MKNKKTISIILAASLTLTACNSDNTEDEETTSSSVVTAAEAETETSAEETTTVKVSAVEDQPENTSVTTVQEVILPEETASAPDGFPAPYPSGAVENAEQLDEFKKIIASAETANSIFYGSHTLVKTVESDQSGYALIDPEYASTMDELIERMYEGFKYSFWEDKYGEEVENMLPRAVKEQEGLFLLMEDGGEQPVIEVGSAVITELSETYATVVALGTLGDKYIWRTYDMLNGVRGWVVRMYDDESVTGEIAVFSQLLIDKMITLDKIFGNAEPVTDENGDWNTQLVTIEDDIYGHGFYNGLEIEPFMTVEEMRQFIGDMFTSEIAKSYISLYVNRSYVEKDGRLYLINGAVLPQTGEFSLEEYENRAIGSFDVTSVVKWSGGESEYNVPVTIKYEDGLWKLDTRLPMREDRIIGR